jgi:hypothetical protein
MAQKIRFLASPLTGMFTVLSLFSQYSYRIPWGELWIPLLIGVVVGFILYGLLLIPKITRPSAPISASVLTAISMFWMLFDNTIFAAGIILAVIALAVKSKPEHIKIANTYFVSMASVAVVLSFVWAGINTTVVKDTETASGNLLNKPDIYFIIPDRMPSHDSLLESGYDNSAFVTEMESRGYYVNPAALSVDKILPSSDDVDTSRTPRFVSSVLNLGMEINVDTPYNVVSRAIKYHMVGKILKANGYDYHHVGTWWSETEVNEMADYNWVMEGSTFMPVDELAISVLDRSIFRYLTTYPFRFFRWNNTLDSMRRDQHLYQMETTKDIAANYPSPKFVFVHLILPHPPYVWTADGQPQENTELIPQEAYLEQIKFCETYLIEMIDSIKDEQAIVIIQADEGMAYQDDTINGSLSMLQWNGVLSAWRIPGADPNELDNVKPNEILKYVIEGLE